MVPVASAKAKSVLVVQTLGGFSARLALGRELFANSKRMRLLFAYLLVHRKAPLSRERIAFALWPDTSDSGALTNLRGVLFRLRKELPDAELFFSANGDAVTWRADAPLDLDIARFEDAMEQASSTSELSAALEFYTGSLLPEFHDDWVVAERERLHLLNQAGLRRLIDLREQQQDVAGAIQSARQLLRTDPLREESYRRLMQIYARKRDRNGLEKIWQECVQIMEAELDLPPSPGLTQEYERFQRVVVAAPPRHNLPSALLPFVGREQELETIAKQLISPDCRMLTLVGAGGIGKSRLAQQVAHAMLSSYLHGVFFVPLADISNVSLVPAHIADQLGLTLRGEGSPERQVLGQLRDKEMLLILDSYEHLLPVTRFVERVLSDAPNVTLMLTSRERLNLRWEWVYAVKGLPVYSAPVRDTSAASAEQALRRMSAAVQLFVQSARRISPSFQLGQENVGQIVEICDLVEGMPLGIELAASWSRLLSPGDILSQLHGSMDLLTTSLRDVPERHRSLRAIFDRSWGLLAKAEQETLSKLSVFRGGFTLAAAIQVIGATVPILASLLDKSLLRMAANGRYDQHEMLRQYAGERLAETTAAQQTARDRHARFYAQHMLMAAQKGIGTPKFMEMVGAEIDNIRQAWNWAMSRQDFSVLAQFILGMGYFYEVRGWRQEAGEVFTTAYETMRPHVYPIALAAPNQIQVFATLLAWMGFFYPERDAEKAFQLEDEALSLLRPVHDGLGLATVLTFRGRRASDLGKYELAQQDLEECMAILHRINEREARSVPLQFLGINYRRTGSYEKAIRCHQEALAISRAAHIDRLTAAALCDLSAMSLLYDDAQEAHRLAIEALTICGRSGDVHLQGVSHVNLGMAALALGDYPAARNALVDALENTIFIEMDIHLARVLALLARTHLALAEAEQGRDYLSRALRTTLEPGYRRAFGIVSNTAGLFLVEGTPNLACSLWQAVQQDELLYHEDRQEAAHLMAQHFSEQFPSQAEDSPANFPALIRSALVELT